MAKTQVVIRQSDKKVTFEFRWNGGYLTQAAKLHYCANTLLSGEGKTRLFPTDVDWLDALNTLFGLRPNLHIPAGEGVYGLNYGEALRYLLLKATGMNFTFESTHLAGEKPEWVRTEVHFFGDFTDMPEGARGELVRGRDVQD